MGDIKLFPNGFYSWQETHFEVVSHILVTADFPGTMPNTAREDRGTGGLYELAEKLTDEFELLNKGRVWDGEFFDEISDFLEAKDKTHLQNS